MAQKQKRDSDSNTGTYGPLVLRLLHIGQELLGQKHGVFDRFSQEIPLAIICQGYGQQAIADLLHISPATVRKYREHIYAQFDVHEEYDIWFAAFSVGLFYPVDGLRPHIMPSDEMH